MEKKKTKTENQKREKNRRQDMSAETIALKMNSLLQEAGVIEKAASNLEAEEARVLATSLLQVADQMDRAGAEEAASHADSALSQLAEDGIAPISGVEVMASDIEPELLLKAASATLLRLSDRFDAMGKEAVADEIDKALGILAG
jgi:hypothetical protein